MGAAVAFQKLLQHTLIAIMLSITPTCAALFFINIPFVSQRRRRGNVLCEKKRKASGWVGFKRVNLNKLKKLLTKDSFFWLCIQCSCIMHSRDAAVWWACSWLLIFSSKKNLLVEYSTTVRWEIKRGRQTLHKSLTQQRHRDVMSVVVAATTMKDIMHSGAFCELNLMPAWCSAFTMTKISSFEMHKMFTMCTFYGELR